MAWPFRSNKFYVNPENRKEIAALLKWLSGQESMRQFYSPPYLRHRLGYRADMSLASAHIQKTASEVCMILKIPEDQISFHMLDQKSRPGFGLHPKNSSVKGLYVPPKEGERFPKVYIGEDVFADADTLLAVMAHELMHEKLLGQERLDMKRNDMELITDVSLAFFGFGIAKLNSARAAGYASAEQIGQALALKAWVQGGDDNWLEHIAPKMRKYFEVPLNLYHAGYPAEIDPAEARELFHLEQAQDRIREALYRGNWQEAEEERIRTEARWPGHPAWKELELLEYWFLGNWREAMRAVESWGDWQGQRYAPLHFAYFLNYIQSADRRSVRGFLDEWAQAGFGKAQLSFAAAILADYGGDMRNAQNYLDRARKLGLSHDLLLRDFLSRFQGEGPARFRDRPEMRSLPEALRYYP